MGIKINAADKAFSKALRESYDWVCQRCHTKYGPDNTRGLECSHYYGRGNYATRYCVDNCDVLCTGCHFYLGGNPNDYRLWKAETYGEGLIQILTDKRNDITLGRLMKRNKKEIADHYKAEYKRLKELRAKGVTGYIELKEW